MNEKDFDLDFDFEKEYGFAEQEDTSAPQNDEDFDLKALLESEFGEEASLFTSEYESDFDYGPETVDYLQDEDAPAPEYPVEDELVDDDFDADLPEEMMSARPLPEEEMAAPMEEPEQVQDEEQAPVRRERRKPVSPMRRF